MHCITHQYDVENEQHPRYLSHNSGDCNWSRVYDPLANYAVISVDNTAEQKILRYVNTVVRNDEELTERILYVCFSAYTNDPINLGIMADSSEGKTYPVTKVTEIFPKDDVIFIGKMSPTALIHQQGTLVDKDGNPVSEAIADIESQLSENSSKEEKTRIKREIFSILSTANNLVILSGKILVFAEPPDHNLWNVLKPILSHDKHEIEYKTTQTDGSLKVKNTIIRGWPAVIFCSAKNEAYDPIWKEIETRFNITSPNTTITKYKDANKYTAKKHGIPSFAKSLYQKPEDEIEARKCVLQIKSSILQFYDGVENPIWNPFHKIIADCFPSNQAKTMRQCDRFLAYCDVSTLMNASKRSKIQFAKTHGTIQQYPITHIDDVDNAISLMGSTSTIPPEKLKFFNDIFLPISTEAVDQSAMSDKLAEKYGVVYSKTITPKQITENYLEPLRSHGIIESREDKSDRRRNLYFVASKPNINNLQFIRDKIIEQSNNNDSFVRSSIDELEECSINEGKITKICDAGGNPLDRNQLQTQIIISSKSNSSPEDQA